MDIKVTVTEVIIENDYIVNKGEYKVNPCEFTFSSEYTDDLVKKAVFVIGNDDIEMAIIDNECDIPYEVLESPVFELHVYAYEVENDELVLRYSPTYAKVFLREGSYRGVTGSGEVITPTQYEQYESALNAGLNEITEGLAEVDSALEEVENVDIDVSKSGTTTTVTITNRQGVQKSEDIEDGSDYVITQADYQAIADLVETEIIVEVPTKVSQLENDTGFITSEVNNLTNYYKKTETYNKTEIDNKVASVYKYKGSVSTIQDLPSTGLTIGDVYNVESDGKNYAWNGTVWDSLGGEIDLSNYYTTTQTDSLLGNKVDKVSGKGLSTNDYTTAEKNKLAGIDLGNYYTKTEIDNMIGDINTLLDEINGEVI